MDIEAQRTAIEDFLTGLLTAFGRSDAEVLAKASDETTIVAEVNGHELGLLVGPKGQTLQALHELTRSMVQRQFVGVSHARLQLDVAGYRERRTAALERFARKIADEVVESGRPKALEPMPANDRKVIHDIVNTVEGVRTVSEGEDPRRRVVIEKD